jgi:hypothetical protein
MYIPESSELNFTINSMLQKVKRHNNRDLNLSGEMFWSMDLKTSALF